jgi:hypothetical protein
MHEKGETGEAVSMLKAIVEKYPGRRDAQALLREITATAQ